MILGIGVDTVDIERFGRHLGRTPSLRDRLFAEGERGLPLRSLAARFAAKEALIKALGGSGGLGWHDMEIVQAQDRSPSFAATPGLLREFALRKHAPQESAPRAGSPADADADAGAAVRAHLSMTHDGGFATAFVILERSTDGAGL